MSTPAERKEIYMTPRWKILRLKVLARDGYCCTTCAGEGVIMAAEIVHHIKPIRAGGDAWDENNLESLCRECHGVEHSDINNPAIAARAEWQALISDLTSKDLPC